MEPQLAAGKSQPEIAADEQPEEPPIKAATPEDPGPIATVVGPMAAWQKRAEAKQAQAAKEADAAKAPMLKPVSQKPQPEDHVLVSASPDPSHFLHKIFAVRTYSEFTFVVPPNMLNPKLHGNFRSFIKGDAPTGSKTADVDVLLLNEQEFNEFANGRRGDATYELDSAHNQAVDYAVPPTHDRAQPYHLVFCNPAGSKPRLVDADFTISFE